MLPGDLISWEQRILWKTVFTELSEEGVVSPAFRGSLFLMRVGNKDQIQDQAEWVVFGGPSVRQKETFCFSLDSKVLHQLEPRINTN